jgi:hypothetical protein
VQLPTSPVPVTRLTVTPWTLPVFVSICGGSTHRSGTKGAGYNKGGEWASGAAASQALADLMAVDEVNRVEKVRRPSDRILGVCTVAGTGTELIFHPQLSLDHECVQTCKMISTTLEQALKNIHKRFELFEERTLDMWDGITAGRFNEVRAFILSNHALLGGILCGLTLCMDGWVEKFPDEESVGPFRRAEYVRNELRRGVEHVRGIRIPKGKDAKSGESEAG